MKSKFKKAKLKTFKRFSFNQTKKTFSKESSQKYWHQWFMNRQPNTFVNWHLSNDENPTKINAFEIAHDNQKQQWKSKRSKDKFQENGNKQLSQNEGANGHKNDFVKQTKVSWKQNGHKAWNPIFLLCQNKEVKILNQKYCVSKINDACNQRKQD